MIVDQPHCGPTTGTKPILLRFSQLEDQPRLYLTSTCLISSEARHYSDGISHPAPVGFSTNVGFLH